MMKGSTTGKRKETTNPDIVQLKKDIEQWRKDYAEKNPISDEERKERADKLHKLKTLAFDLGFEVKD